ncbi:MAG TPA: hypothetical protein VEU08_00800, partial [Vicinamibacterales bacterium]|nr:hypothetical protein [Vicinamibacterales bacterium]
TDVQATTLIALMLAGSTGFRDRLIRGHFDPLLAGKRSRCGIAAAHAAFSIVPGLMFWLLVGGLEILTHPRRVVAFSAGALTAVTYILTVVWTVSLLLGRHTGGVLWIFTLFLLASGHRLHEFQEAYGTSSASFAVSAAAARAALVWPIALLSNGGHVDPLVHIIVIAVTIVLFAGGVLAIVRMDAPLRGPA